MDVKTLEALKGSIKKWEKIAAGTGADQAWINCPLCAAFLERGCEGCPVNSVTRGGCDNKEFVAWKKSRTRWSAQLAGYVASSAKSRKAAQAEVNFLRSLLPTQAQRATSRKKKPSHPRKEGGT